MATKHRRSDRGQRNWLANCLDWFQRSESTPTRTLGLRSRRCNVEPLESRQLLSASPWPEMRPDAFELPIEARQELEQLVQSSPAPAGSLPYGATWADTSEYMLGDVSVTVVLLESDGSIDSESEDWTQAEINQIKAEVQEGLDWWEATLANTNPGTPHGLDFHIDFAYADSPVATGYEPITRPHTDQGLWIDSFLDAVGYNTGSSYFTDLRTWNNDQRLANNTDWAYTVFVVDSSVDANNMFSDGYFAYAYPGGPFTVLTYGNDGWGIEDFGQVLAHETGHIFYALDEYPGSNDYTAHSGYYNTQNLNASDDHPDPGSRVNSIMAEPSRQNPAYAAHTSSPTSLEMIGWRDSDSDGVFDVLDVPLTLTGSGVHNATLGQYEFSGDSAVQTLTNQNPRGGGRDMTINTVDRIQYRVDGGSWIDGNSYGTYTPNVSQIVPVPPGSHTIDVRTGSTDSGVASNIISADVVAAAAEIHGGKFHDSDGDGAARESGEKWLPGWTVYLDNNNNGVRDGAATASLSSGTLNRAITDAGAITASLSFDTAGVQVDDLNVTLHIDHDYNPDLDVYLISPSGTRVELFTDLSGSGFIATTLDDEAATPITAGAPPYDGSFRPEGALGSIEGELAYGAWTLEITDDVAADTGTLIDWSLDFTTSEASTVTNAAGEYSFVGLPAGDYVVREEAQSGWVQRFPSSGSYAITLASGQIVTDKNFGNYRLNNPPQGRDKTVTILEDETYVFAAADFGFHDPLDNPPNGFAGAWVDPAANMRLDGAEVTARTFVTAGALDAGRLTFVPPADVNGVALGQVTFSVKDDGGTLFGGQDTDPTPNTMTIDVTAVNDEPVRTDPALLMPIEAAEDEHNNDAVSLGLGEIAYAPGPLTATDELASQTLSYTITAIPSTIRVYRQSDQTTPIGVGAVLSLGELRGLMYKTVPNANSPGELQWTVVDSGLGASPHDNTLVESLPVTVTEVNDTPVAFHDYPRTAEDAPIVIDAAMLIANDVKGPANEGGQTLRVLEVVPTPDTHGTLVVNKVGGYVVDFLYTPDPEYHNDPPPWATFRYLVEDDGTTDGAADPKSTWGMVFVTVAEVNDPPVANPDVLGEIPEDTTLVIPIATLLGNDTVAPAGAAAEDEAWQQLTHIEVRATADPHGSIAPNGVIPITPDGTLEYTPGKNRNGLVSFEYRVMDDGYTADVPPDGSDPQWSEWTTVSFHVTQVNDAPVFYNDPRTDARDPLPGNDEPDAEQIHLQTDEDADLLIDFVSIEDVDVDEVGEDEEGNPVVGDGRVEVSLWAEHGTVTLPDVVGLTFLEGDGASDASMTFEGLLPDVNDALANMVYRGNLNYNGPDTIHMNVDDLGNTGAGGPLKDYARILVDVLPVNDAPVLDPSGIATFTSITEDDVDNPGNTVQDVIDSVLPLDMVTDPDAGALEGFAIVGAGHDGTGDGHWEYDLYDAPDGWRDVDAVSDAGALLLRPEDRLRFVPDEENGETGWIVFRAWDQTTGNAGEKVSAVPNGGTTAFSTARETASIDVTHVNDAPVLHNEGNPVFTTINEDQLDNSGDTVATMIASVLPLDMIADVDVGALEGIAVTGATHSDPNSTGKWQFSLDAGNTWADLAAVSVNSGLLLRPQDKIRYVPGGLNGETAEITFSAWDQTEEVAPGKAGDYVDTRPGGGISAFSIAEETATITVLSVNDAPILDPAMVNDFQPIDEDDVTNDGEAVRDLLDDAVIDPDYEADEPGLALAGLNATNGRWQYKMGDGPWTDVGFVSDTQSLLLGPDDRVRFLPNEENGSVDPTTGEVIANTIVYRAWDRSAGTAGNKVDTNTNGGSTPYSTATGESAIVVASLNDAPVLHDEGDPTLTTIHEDQVGNSGNTVAEMIGSVSPLDMITDVDYFAVEGIAVIGTSHTGLFDGHWEYDLHDDALGWIDVGAVAADSALLLRPEDKLRFVPDTKQGETALISFRAWDQTEEVAPGEAGQKVDPGAGGGRTAFSIDSIVETASITVRSINDAPELTVPGTQNVDEDTALIISGISVDDVDLNEPPGTGIIEITMWADHGVIGLAQTTALSFQPGDGDGEADRYMRFRGTRTAVNNALAEVTYTPDADYNYDPVNDPIDDRIHIRANDLGNTGADPSSVLGMPATGGPNNEEDYAEVPIEINPINDAPVLLDTDVQLREIREDSRPSWDAATLIENLVDLIPLSGDGQDNVTDVDDNMPEPALTGVAITGVTEAHGAWWYAIDIDDDGVINASDWVRIGQVSDSESLLLPADGRTRIFYEPNPNYNTNYPTPPAPDVLTFRAWDQTTEVAPGGPEDRVNTADPNNGGRTAFSETTDIITADVTPVNDRPVPFGDNTFAIEDEDTSFPTSLLIYNDVAGPVDETPWPHGFGDQTLEVVQVKETSHYGGIVRLDGLGNIIYTPPSEFYTENDNLDWFEYKVEDSGDFIIGGTITLDNGWTLETNQSVGRCYVCVVGVNDEPVPAPDAASTTPGAQLTLSAASLTANDSPGANESEQTLTVIGVEATADSHGSVVLDGENIVYTPDAGFQGEARFLYTVEDNGLDHNGLPDYKQAVTEVVVSVTGSAPVVSAVRVASSLWQPSFIQALQGMGPGNTDGFYQLSTGVDQLASLPWTGLDRVRVVFSEDVEVVIGDLRLIGVNIGEVAATDFVYQPATTTATWTFPMMGTDKWLLALSDGVSSAVSSLPLDGEYADGIGQTASGDSIPGGDFLFRFNTLPADSDRDAGVKNSDILAVLPLRGKTPGDDGYDPFRDIDGDGGIKNSDILAILPRRGATLPDGEPELPPAPAPSPMAEPLASPSLDLYGEVLQAALDEQENESTDVSTSLLESRRIAPGDWDRALMALGEGLRGKGDTTAPMFGPQLSRYDWRWES